ncbi:hypothetical protein GGX14DRAFT_320512, partial [Mycena pura]
LVELRKRHETKFAARAVRVTATRSISESSSDAGKAKMAKQIAEALRDVMRSSQTRGVTTGLARSMRTITPIVVAPGGRRTENDALPAGNAHNAVVNATAQATKLQAKRARVWLKAGLNALEIPPMGLVSDTYPIRHESYGIFYHEEGLRLTIVTSLYSRTAGKSSKHAYTSESGKVTALSYIVAQVFE